MFCDNKKNVQIAGEAIPECNVCREDLLYLDGTCVNKCPEDRVINKTNRLCEVKKACEAKNCDQCDVNSKTVCNKCQRGTFKHNGQCLEVCPTNFRADRITWTCLEVPVFAWYWVYPSMTSCKTNCGLVIQSDSDCSCHAGCFYYGNCCQDIEDYCPSLLFWRKKGKTTSSTSKTTSSNLKPNINTNAATPSKKEKKVDIKTTNETKQPNTFLKKKD